MDQRVIHDFVCTACGCACDDLVVTVRDERIAEFAPPCPLAAQLLLAERPAAPATEDLSGLVTEAADLLRAARAPLILGLERASVESQRLAIACADRLGAVLIPTDEGGAGPSQPPACSLGEVTATLGEVAQRSDLVLYWQCDPATTHPRHIERFASRAGQRRIVVDSWPSPTAALADEYMLIPADGGAACLAALRAAVRGIELDADHVELQTGIAWDAWQRLADALRRAQYAAIFHDAAIFYDAASRGVPAPGASGIAARRGTFEANRQAITTLVRELHRHTRAVSLPLGAAWNAVGAAQVLTWQTGFPGAVSFARGYPQQLLGQATAAGLLSRREVDAALIIAADPLPRLPAAAAAHLRAIPTIVLDDRDTATIGAATVAIHVAAFGLETAGTTFRSDGVALPLRPALVTALPQTADVLQQIANHLARR